MYGNPVAQRLIRPFGAPAIVGDFRVTDTFAGHVASRRPPGVDLGNGRCGEPVLAMADGPVSLAGTIGLAKVVRIRHPQFGDHETGYAHLATISVGGGQFVHRGDRIGTLGSTGATACHLHVGLKIAGVETDVWPYLDQNMETDMLKGTNPRRVVNRQTRVLGANTRFRPSPGTAEPELGKYAAGTLFYPDHLVTGGLANGSTDWAGGWCTTPRGIEFGYFSVTVLEPFSPIEQSGHTDQELTDAINAGRAAGIKAAADAAAATT